MVETTVTVVTICAPLFVMVLFGYMLKRSGALGAEAHQFISWFVYNFSLPVLIFTNIARTDFRSLLNASVVFSTLGACAIVGALTWLSASALKRDTRSAGVVIAFMANIAYLGFPLARNAFGEAGLVYAGIVNAFTMPVFTVACVFVLAVGGGTGLSTGRQLLGAVSNPAVVGAFAGIVVSLIAFETPVGVFVEGSLPGSSVVSIVNAVLQPIGAVGMPLSLVAVGASLRFAHIRTNAVSISLLCVAKLVVAPALTLAACHLLFPGADRAAVGTAVLLMACPVAVGLYVIASQMKVQAEYVAAALAATTAASCVTIPIWVALVL